MGELMTDKFTVVISSGGKTLTSTSEHDHSKLHALLNTPIKFDHTKTWYAKMSSIEISKNVDTLMCAPEVKKELSIRVGRMKRCPHKVDPNTLYNMPVKWIGETSISFDFSADLKTPTPSFTSATDVVNFMKYNPNFNRVKLQHDFSSQSEHTPPKSDDQRIILVLPPIDIFETFHRRKVKEVKKHITYTKPEDTPDEVIYEEPPVKKQKKIDDAEILIIEKEQPWSHVNKIVKQQDLPDRYFSLTDVLEVKAEDDKLDFKVIAGNPYAVNYAVIRAPSELSYVFGFPYEFSAGTLSSCDNWYLAEGGKRWRIKACGVRGNVQPWDIWRDNHLQIYHFSEICNPLYEVDNVKVITDFTELPVTENKQVINTIPLGAWISDPATKHYHMCIQSMHRHEWRRVITPGSSSISSMKLHLESVSGYPLRILGRRKATRISVTFLPI